MPSISFTKSGYYHWRKRPKSEQKKKKEALTREVKRVFVESKNRYGSPKITKVLRQKDIQTTEKTVSRIRCENNMRSKVVKKYKATTNSKHQLPIFPNLYP